MSIRRIVFGSVMMTGGHAFRIALQIILLPFLASQLGPTAYGLVALTMPVVFLALLLGTGGLGAGLIRDAGFTAEVESTAFWFSLASGSGERPDLDACRQTSLSDETLRKRHAARMTELLDALIRQQKAGRDR